LLLTSSSGNSWLFDGFGSWLGNWLSSGSNWLFFLGLRLEFLLLALEKANDVAGCTTRPGAALAGLLALLGGGLGWGFSLDAFLWGRVRGLGGANRSDDCSSGLCKRKNSALAAATRKCFTT
jgi:hypothetical protein